MSLPVATYDSIVSRFFVAIYGWMTVGLALTAGIAYWVSQDPVLMKAIFTGPVVIALCVIELIMVMIIAACHKSLGGFWAGALFLIYAALNGLTFSGILHVYELPSIFAAFGVTAGMYAATALYGLVTKRDLSGMGSFLFMALIGLILAMVVNIFLQNAWFDWVTSFIGVIVFVALTAYDHQKLKELCNYDVDDSDAVSGALMLYLDFLNMFLFILKLIGKKD